MTKYREISRCNIGLGFNANIEDYVQKFKVDNYAEYDAILENSEWYLCTWHSGANKGFCLSRLEPSCYHFNVSIEVDDVYRMLGRETFRVVRNKENNKLLVEYEQGNKYTGSKLIGTCIQQ